MPNRQAEEATGCRQVGGLGKYYARGGRELTIEQAAEILMTGGEVEVPNAGAGSYDDFFATIPKIKSWTPWDQQSSSGDWSFKITTVDGRSGFAYQEHRFPYHGYRYSTDL